jgi:phosphoribosylformylglycinamidine (FGAM) synthase-like enzyme
MSACASSSPWASNPDRIAILDNFCMGNPDNERELGALVECTKAWPRPPSRMVRPSSAARTASTTTSSPTKAPSPSPSRSCSAASGIVEDAKHVVGASLRRVGSKIAVLGKASAGLRGSIVAKYTKGIGLDAGPSFDEAESMAAYRRYFDLVKQGADPERPTTSAKAASPSRSPKWPSAAKPACASPPTRCPSPPAGLTTAELLFGETPGRLLVEIAPEHVAAAEKAGLALIGEATRDPYLYISHNGTTLIDSPIDQLKPLWKDGLVKYY